MRADFFAEIKVERLHNTSGNNVKPLYFLLFFFPWRRFVPFPPIRAVVTNQGTLLGKEVALVSKCYSGSDWLKGKNGSILSYCNTALYLFVS